MCCVCSSHCHHQGRHAPTFRAGCAERNARLLQTVSFSEETKDEINLDLLDDVAWHQIQKLTVNSPAPAAAS